MSERPKQMFFQGSQQAYEKMLSITNHQRNADQNHSKISPDTDQNGYDQKEHK